MEAATKEQKFSYHRWIRFCLVANEEIGEVLDVKQKLTLFGRGRRDRSNLNHFDCVAAGPLDVGKHCHDREANHDRSH